MQIDTVRSKEIDAYLKGRSPEPNRKAYVEYEGKMHTLDVYSFPTSKLIFNIQNGRFAAELKAKEEELKRKLDPRNSQDEDTIRTLLLELDPNETEALKENLALHGQIDPGIISFDGAVINANRRMAVFNLLHKETGESRYQYLLAARLPRHVDEKDMWRIEAGLQFGKDFRLKYGPVNELLKLKEGADRGLSDKEISKTLLGRFSPQGVRDRLAVLKLIDDYLAFIKKEGKYDILHGDVEKFNSLYGVLKGLKKRGPKSPDIAKIITMAFLMIDKTDRSHWDIRKFREISLEKEANKILLKNFNAKKPSTMKQEDLEEAFQGALDVVEDTKEHNKPARLLNRALTAIKHINPKSARLKDAPVQKLIKEISAELKSLERK